MSCCWKPLLYLHYSYEEQLQLFLLLFPQSKTHTNPKEVIVLKVVFSCVQTAVTFLIKSLHLNALKLYVYVCVCQSFIFRIIILKCSSAIYINSYVNQKKKVFVKTPSIRRQKIKMVAIFFFCRELKKTPHNLLMQAIK